MRYIAAYALLILSGKESPTEQEIAKLIEDAGSNPDPNKIKCLLESVKGKKFNKIIGEGHKSLGDISETFDAVAAGGELPHNPTELLLKELSLPPEPPKTKS